MSADVSASTVLLVGVMLVRIVASDVYQRYVRVGMGPWLLLSGVLLITLGLVMVVRALRAPRPDDDRRHDQHEHPEPDREGHDHEGHHHVGGDRVGWLLLLPVLALLLVAPPALGSYGVDRAANVRVGQGAAVWSVLPGSAAPHAMTLLELNERAWDRRGASLAAATVELTGFAAGGEAGPRAGPQAGAEAGAEAGAQAGSFRLARYQIACCAADAVPSVAHVTGLSGAAPTRDTWARVIGRFTGTAADGLPIVEATSVQTVPTPVDPYE